MITRINSQLKFQILVVILWYIYYYGVWTVNTKHMLSQPPYQGFFAAESPSGHKPLHWLRMRYESTHFMSLFNLALPRFCFASLRVRLFPRLFPSSLKASNLGVFPWRVHLYYGACKFQECSLLIYRAFWSAENTVNNLFIKDWLTSFAD